MNKQEILDFTFEKLWNQNRKSSDMGAGCSYRGPDGTKCAVGWLIPDEVYDKSMEGHLVNLMSLYPSIDAFKDDSNYAILIEIQRAHDSIGVVSNFRQSLKNNYNDVAKMFNLDSSFINSFNEE